MQANDKSTLRYGFIRNSGSKNHQLNTNFMAGGGDQVFSRVTEKIELPNKDVIEPEGAGYVTADQQTKSKWSFQPHCKALKYKLLLFNKQAQAWSWFLWNTKPLSILCKDVLELTLPKVARFQERIAVRKLEHVACHLRHRENFTLSVSYSQLVVLA